MVTHQWHLLTHRHCLIYQTSHLYITKPRGSETQHKTFPGEERAAPRRWSWPTRRQLGRGQWIKETLKHEVVSSLLPFRPSEARRGDSVWSPMRGSYIDLITSPSCQLGFGGLCVLLYCLPWVTCHNYLPTYDSSPLLFSVSPSSRPLLSENLTAHISLGSRFQAIWWGWKRAVKERTKPGGEGLLINEVTVSRERQAGDGLAHRCASQSSYLDFRSLTADKSWSVRSSSDSCGIC